jgi:hypothetical protein
VNVLQHGQRLAEEHFGLIMMMMMMMMMMMWMMMMMMMMTSSARCGSDEWMDRTIRWKNKQVGEKKIPCFYT